MSPRPRFRHLFRWSLLWGMLYLLQVFSFVFVPRHEGVHFAGGHLLLPFAIGLMLNLVIVEVMHRPFSFLLPGASRCFKKYTLIAYALASLPLIWLAHWRNPEIPLAASLGLVAAGMAMAIPWSSYCKWNGSLKAGLSWLVFTGLCAWRYEEVKFAANAFPWLVGGAGVVFAGYCFRLGFSRESLRRRALEYYIALPSIMFNSDMMRRNQERALARSRKMGRGWLRSPVGKSIWNWSSAVRFEVDGMVSRPWLLYLGMGLFIAAAWAFMSYAMMARSGAVTSGRIFGTLYDALFGSLMHSPTMQLFSICALIPILQTNFPAPVRLYPASRAYLRRVALWIGVRQFLLAVGLVVFIYAVLGVVACFGTGRPFAFGRLPIYTIPTAMVPLLPVAIWGVFLNRRGGAAPSAGYIAVFLTIMWSIISICGIAMEWLLSPGGLVIVFIGLVTNSAIFVRSVRTFYLEGDLVARGAR